MLFAGATFTVFRHFFGQGAGSIGGGREGEGQRSGGGLRIIFIDEAHKFFSHEDSGIPNVLQTPQEHARWTLRG